MTETNEDRAAISRFHEDFDRSELNARSTHWCPTDWKFVITLLGKAFQAGRDSKDTGWVKIEDIPQEWREADFLVDVWVKSQGYSYRLKDCIFINGHWEDETGLEHNGVTHAMLPPQPPKEACDGY